MWGAKGSREVQELAATSSEKTEQDLAADLLGGVCAACLETGLSPTASRMHLDFAPGLGSQRTLLSCDRIFSAEGDVTCVEMNG